MEVTEKSGFMLFPSPFFNANINEEYITSPSACVSTTQLSDSAARSSRTGRDNVYLPAIPRRALSLNSIKGALSQSCPYLHDKRRGSVSSVASQRTGGHNNKQVICETRKYELTSLIREKPHSFQVLSSQSI